MAKRSKRRKLIKKLQRRSGLVHPSRRPLRPPSYRDNFGNIISPIELAFPIIRYTAHDQFEAVGTGFFIHPAGGFVTQNIASTLETYMMITAMQYKPSDADNISSEKFNISNLIRSAILVLECCVEN